MACPIIVGDGVASFVYTGYNSLMGYAGNAYQLATQTFNQLLDYQVDPISVDVNYHFDDSLFAYVRPAKPDVFAEDLEADFSLENAPLPTAQRPTFDYASPTLEASPPVIHLPNTPGSLTAQPPGGPPILADVEVPAAPNIVLPTEPALLSVLPLPDVPNIVLPTFQGVRPDFDIEMPDPNIHFEPVPYTSDLLDQVKAKLASMMLGGTGLPAAVEQALVNRAVAREDESAARTIEETTDEFARLGFSEPNGVLSKRLLKVRQDTQNKRASLSRDIYIKAVDVEIENLRFSVTQGVALESALLSNWLQYQQLILESQKFVLQVALDLTNVKIQLFNAKLAQFQIDATVYKTRIEAELAKLEIYKAQLDAKRLLLQINQQEIQIYEARLRAVMTAIDIYKAQIEGVRALVETNNQKLEGYRVLVQAYAERVRAYQAEWEGYKAAAEAEGTKAQIFDTSVKAYLGEVQAWAAKNSNAVELGKFDIELDRSRLENWRGKLEKYLGDLRTKVAVFEAKVGAYDSTVRAYSAESQVEVAAAETNTRIFDLGMRREQARKEIALKNLELSINQLVQLSNQLLEAKKAVAAGAGQLAASSLSAVSFGASVNSGLSQSQSCSTSYSFNTELLPEG